MLSIEQAKPALKKTAVAGLAALTLGAVALATTEPAQAFRGGHGGVIIRHGGFAGGHWGGWGGRRFAWGGGWGGRRLAWGGGWGRGYGWRPGWGYRRVAWGPGWGYRRYGWGPVGVGTAVGFGVGYGVASAYPYGYGYGWNGGYAGGYEGSRVRNGADSCQPASNSLHRKLRCNWGDAQWGYNGSRYGYGG